MATAEKIGRNLREIGRAVLAGPAARRRVARRYIFDALRWLVPTVGVDTPEGRLFVATADRVIGREVFVAGGWEPGLLHRALELCGTPSEGTFVEVGANIGTTTVSAARLMRRVIAVEPAPSNLCLLRANVAANELDNVVVVQAACSAADGSGFLHLSPTNSGDHRVAERGGIAVPLRSLDAVLAELGVDDVRFLWVDTQGHEAEVLTGAGGLLASLPPLLIEFWPPVLGEAGAARLLDLTSGYGRCVDMSTGSVVTDRGALPALYRHGSTDLLFTE